jgi:hypothetical protein
MKLTADRPTSDPEAAARRLMQHARAFEPVQDGRINVEKLNRLFLFEDKGTPAEYSHARRLRWAGLNPTERQVRSLHAKAARTCSTEAEKEGMIR